MTDSRTRNELFRGAEDSVCVEEWGVPIDRDSDPNRAAFWP